MPEKLNLKGQRFGRWIVLEETENKKDGTAWLCQCNCGKLDMSPEEFLDWRRRIANKLRLDFLKGEFIDV